MGPDGIRGGVRVAFSGKGMEQGLRFNNSTYLHDLAGSEPIPKMGALALWICCSCEIIRNNKWQTHPAWILAWFLFPTYPCPLGRTVTFCRYLDFFSLSQRVSVIDTFWGWGVEGFVFGFVWSTILFRIQYQGTSFDIYPIVPWWFVWSQMPWATLFLHIVNST